MDQWTYTGGSNPVKVGAMDGKFGPMDLDCRIELTSKDECLGVRRFKVFAEGLEGTIEGPIEGPPRVDTLLLWCTVGGMLWIDEQKKADTHNICSLFDSTETDCNQCPAFHSCFCDGMFGG